MRTPCWPLPVCCVPAAVWSFPLSVFASITEYQAAVRGEASLISYCTFDADNQVTVNVSAGIRFYRLRSL